MCNFLYVHFLKTFMDKTPQENVTHTNNEGFLLVISLHIDALGIPKCLQAKNKTIYCGIQFRSNEFLHSFTTIIKREASTVSVYLYMCTKELFSKLDEGTKNI